MSIGRVEKTHRTPLLQLTRELLRNGRESQPFISEELPRFFDVRHWCSPPHARRELKALMEQGTVFEHASECNPSNFAYKFSS